MVAVVTMTVPQTIILRTVTLFSGTLSVLGSGFIILTFLIYSDLRTPARRFLVALSICDIFVAFFNAFGSLFESSEYPTFCTIQSAITTYFSISSFFWTAGLAVYLYLALSWDLKSKATFVTVPAYYAGNNNQGVVQEQHVTQKKDSGWKVFGVFSLICWGIPAIVIGVALSFGALGGDIYSNTVGWCWISKDKDELFLFWGLIAGKGNQINFTFIHSIFKYYCLPSYSIKNKKDGKS